MSDKTPNPTRLRLARGRCGISMRQLAEQIGVQPRSISAFEKGEFSPSEDTLKELAKSLRFPVEFFFGPDIEQPEANGVSFRALSRMTAGQRDSALGAGAIALLLNDWLEAKFELPSNQIPDLVGVEPEAAAEAVRSQWGIGNRPIRNVIHLLESKGVRVFSLAEDNRRVDAYSYWQTETPFVFLNTKKSAERSRFDAAHELGHLVLHKHGAPVGQEAEMQANTFASALLMSASSIMSTVRRTPTVRHLVQLKKNWGVSVAALLYRLHKMNIVSDWHYRTMCIDIAPYRTDEPNPMPRERSLVLPKAFAELAKENYSKSSVAKELNVHTRQIEELVFGLTVSEGNNESSKVAHTRPKLTIIK